MAEILSTTNLVKRYKDLTAVDGINLSIREGICFGLLGPNGAGKTTTIEMLEGILKPTSGEIFFFGKPASRERYTEIGIQFQSTALQDFLTVKETLELFQAFYERTMPLEQIIELCALEPYLNQDNRKLSGGQRQRLLLALALVNDPKILFLDEPTTGLDPQSRRNFWDLVKNIKAQNKTILLTTHYMDEAQELCDEIVVIDQGKIIEKGAPGELLASHFSGSMLKLPLENVPEAMRQSMNFVATDTTVELTTENIDDTIRELVERGIRLDGLHIQSPNLEDLFLKLTGHKLRA